MKNLLVIALALVTLNGVAQERKKDSKDRKDRMERMKDITPTEIADLKSKKLTLALDLSEAQQKEVYQLILTDATEHQKMRAERIANKTEDAKPTKEEMVKMRNQKLDQLIEMKRKMKSILNAEQYEKFEKMSHRNRKGKRNHRRKM
ncbi:hypothetical protein [Winogradskyella ursingii]|uniref:hypothetical protein n=1 Tax=Winogradskyella ursingii TaxID=2686079 RepID=UPI0015CE9526|nr:hypothetical protein [Winogradskyella ursingii]